MKRATLRLAAPTVRLYDFNPRPREEGDGIRWLTSAVPSDFNPRPREEGDATTLNNAVKQIKFQSTPS